MKKSFLIYICSLVSVFVFVSCSSSDSTVKHDVENALKTNYPYVNVSVNDQVVTLTGEVDTNEQRMAAENTAKTVKHVKSVVNNIDVRAAVQTPNITRSADEVLQTTIRSGYTLAGYNDVHVEVNDGEVILTGNVKRDDLQKVMQIANEANPKRVVNQLTIE